MSSAGSFFVRYRVRLGYPLAFAVLIVAKPTARSIFYGALIGLVGLAIRAWAAGYLHKQQVLTISGPYAYTRNPLYLGSSILALGVAVALHSWISALLLGAYFIIFYTAVMRKEESELRLQHPATFDWYLKSVPLFFPRLTPAGSDANGRVRFSVAQYVKNHEWQAAAGFTLFLAVLLLIRYFETSR